MGLFSDRLLADGGISLTERCLAATRIPFSPCGFPLTQCVRGTLHYIQVHPTFLYEGVWNLGVLGVMLLYHKRKKYNGQMCLFYLGGYGIGRFVIEGIRTDRLLIPGTQVAVSQVLGLAMFVFAVGMNAFVRYRLSKSSNRTEKGDREL